MAYAALVGLLFAFGNIFATASADLEQKNADGGVPTRQVKVYQHMLPEKNKWYISKKEKKICEGGPYSQWYSNVKSDCNLPEGSYTVTCCDTRSNEGWAGGYVHVAGKDQKLCHKFAWNAKKKCHTEKFTVARIPTPRPTPKPTPPLENQFYKCLKKSAKAMTQSVPYVWKFKHKGDGEKGLQINDGGYDMYDNGNKLFVKYGNSDFHGPLKYVQRCGGSFQNYGGPGDIEYFTCKEATPNGDIFFAGFRSKKGHISGFSTGGNTGADNDQKGWIDAELKPFKKGHHWWAYRKSLATTNPGHKDPTINHLILVPKKTWEHDWPRNNNENRRRTWAKDIRRRRAYTTDLDWHEVRAKNSNDWVSHLLYVDWGGRNNAAKQKAYRYSQALIEKFLSKINLGCT